MSEFDRAGFLKRLTAATGALFVPPAVLEALRAETADAAPVAAPAPYYKLTGLSSSQRMLYEWWAESGSDEPVTVSLVETSKRVVLYQHTIPPQGGIYVQYPLGREPLYDQLKLCLDHNHWSESGIRFERGLNVARPGMAASMGEIPWVPLFAGVVTS